ncbi:MAG: bestrophin-like domain [Burkholderiales bacterium]
MGDIARTLDIRIVVIILVVAMLAAWSIGKRLGARLLQEGGSKPSKFDDASMALLSLLLAFSFGMSIARHDQRRLAVVADSNAIGDFYTCASILKEPSRAKLQSVIRQYVQLRLDLTRGARRRSDLESALVKFDQLHAQMTEIVAQAVSDGTPIAVSLTNTLNAVTSNQASRLAAHRDRLPTGILFLLFACSIVTVLLIGREQGAANNTEIVGTLCFIFLVSIAVYVTLDLNQPEGGSIRVSQEPIERLLSSMSK